MLRKRSPNLDTGWRAGARQITCDFNSRRTSRAKPVKISAAGPGTLGFVRGRFLPQPTEARSAGLQKKSVRWYQFEALRDGFTLRRACNPERWFGSAASPIRSVTKSRDSSSRICVVACVMGSYSPVFFLLCLTGGPIFDNRHGLHTKCDGGRAVKTLSAAKPQV
jgi:hypothetical protein